MAQQPQEIVTMFMTDAAELLDKLESGLLALERNAQDRDVLDDIFRNMHTIKGNAAVVHQGEIEWFAHVAESVLLRLRNGALNPDGELISVFLACCDHLRFLVSQAGFGHQISPHFANADRTQLIGLLVAYLGEDVDLPLQPEAGAAAGGTDTTWHLSLSFSSGVLLRGMDPLDFIRHLASVGRIIDVSVNTDMLPAAADYDPENCYLGFEVDLDSPADRQSIEDVFSFLGVECTLVLTPPPAYVDNYVKRIESVPDDLQTGEMLMRVGALTPNELDRSLRQQRSGTSSRRPLGDILVEDGVVAPEVIQAVLLRQDEIKLSVLGESQQLRVPVEELDQLASLLDSALQSLLGLSVRGTAATPAEILALRSVVEKAQAQTEKLRTTHFHELFRRLHRAVRDAGVELGKRVDLLVSGGEIALDRSVAVLLADMLMHLLRNAVDHGIETPVQRGRLGKSMQGTLSVQAREDGEDLVFTVSDDGAGIDPEQVREVAVACGKLSADAHPEPQALYAMLFDSGFSTTPRANYYSGRGVGLDVVRETVAILGGDIILTSQPGKGTRFEIRLPREPNGGYVHIPRTHTQNSAAA